MNEPDIERLRRDAAARAAARPPLPFDGLVRDATLGPVPVRAYLPRSAAHPERAVVFLHGGYGVLGDVDLQDGTCRRIAGMLRAAVWSVGYRLAPEATLDDAAADALAAVDELRSTGADDVVLWGDSAGGAVALVAARRARATALVLTNPNIDLTLSGYDDSATGGPGRELSEWAFAHWAGGGRLQDAPDLAADVHGLPPTFVATGSEDSLAPDARRFVRLCRDAGVRADLHVVPGASHGFMGGPDIGAVTDTIRRAGAFAGFDVDAAGSGPD